MRSQKAKQLKKRERKAEKQATLSRLCADATNAIFARLVVLRMTTSLRLDVIVHVKKRVEELRLDNQLYPLYRVHTAVLMEHPEETQFWTSRWEWEASLNAALASPRTVDTLRFITDEQLDAVSSDTKFYAAQAQTSRPPRKLSPTGRTVR